VLAGNSASFTVKATGTDTLTYQWYFDGKKISGATKATYTITNVAAANVGNYTVVISNGIGSPVTSSPVTLTLVTAPKITTQPKALALAYGASGNLTVAATGTTLNYLWHRNNAIITANNVTSINGSKLIIIAATSANAGSYTVAISNNYGSITSGIAKVTVTVTPPKITKQPVAPKPAPTPVGSSVNFSVTATGSNTPLLYQWTFNSKPVTFSNASGTTSKELSLTNVTSANTGIYQVIVSNTAATVKSTTVKFTVK